MTKISISILFAICAVPVLAQNAPRNELSMGASYSSLHGAVGLIGFDGKDIVGSGIDLSLDYRKGETGNGGTAVVRYSRDIAWDKLGQDAQLIFSGEYLGSNWSDEAYKSETRKLSIAFGAALSPNFSYSTKLFWQYDTLSDLGASASPLVTAAEGTSTSAGVAIDGHFGRLEGGALPVSGFGLDTGLSWAGLGDRKTSATYAALTFAQPLGGSKTMVLRAEAGAIAGLQGHDVSILDRAFLGGAGGPRGYGFGGIGPRDYVAGSVDTPLGGSRYSTVSMELRGDVSEKLAVGAFLDGGAVWDLGDTPLIGAMGAIDDSRKLRSSIGLAVYYDTALGKLSVNVAKPLESQVNDSFNELSVGFTLSRDSIQR
jgi:outer membrane protein insertion porin family